MEILNAIQIQNSGRRERTAPLGSALYGRMNARLATLRAVWLVVAGLFSTVVPPGFAEVSKEYELKAVFLWRLTQFTEWPANAFATPESPIVIGILGENPFGKAVELAVRGETAHGRPLVVQYYRRWQEIGTCHVLFISTSEAGRVSKIISGLGNRRSILLVSEIENFARSSGGMVRFITEQDKVRLRVNMPAVAAAHLTLDARLLRAAEVIGK